MLTSPLFRSLGGSGRGRKGEGAGAPSPPAPLPRCGRPSPPAPLPHCGRGVVVVSVSLQDADAGSPRLCLPLPSSAPFVGAAGVEGGRCGGTLTPSPSPALRERGELVRGLDDVDRRWRRIATAMLTSPLFHTLGGSGRGGRGKVRGHPHPQPLSRTAGEGWSWSRYRCKTLTQDRHGYAYLSPLPLPWWKRHGRKGEGEGGPSPPAPLPRCGRGGSWFVDLTTLTDAGAGSPRLRLPLPSSAPLVGAAGAEGGRCGGTLTPSPSPALRERGELVRGLDDVDRRWRRIATAMLTSPLFHTLGGSGRGGRGKVRSIIPPFLSRSVGEEGG